MPSATLSLLIVWIALCQTVSAGHWKECDCSQCSKISPPISVSQDFMPPCSRPSNPWFGRCSGQPGAASVFISNVNIRINTYKNGGRSPLPTSCPDCEKGSQNFFSCINPAFTLSDVVDDKNLAIARITCGTPDQLCLYTTDGKRYQGSASKNMAVLPVPYCPMNPAQPDADPLTAPGVMLALFGSTVDPADYGVVQYGIPDAELIPVKSWLDTNGQYKTYAEALDAVPYLELLGVACNSCSGTLTPCDTSVLASTPM